VGTMMIPDGDHYNGNADRDGRRGGGRFAP
jgi:hypothetical protein